MTRSGLAIAIGLVAAVGCRATGVFQCEENVQCRLGGQIGACEPNGYCSFPDGACASGSRYDDLAGGGLGGTCVGDEPGADAGGDCPWQFSPTNVDPCVAPVGPVRPALVLTMTGQDYDFDTGNGQLQYDEMSIATPASTTVAQTGGPTVRVLNLAGLTLPPGATLNLKGPMPAVIIVHGSTNLGGRIVVESGRGTGGACGDGTTGAASTGAGTGGGAGGGGAFGGDGMLGGNGGTGLLGGMAGAIRGEPMLSPLRGGCDGGFGGAAATGGFGGDRGDGGGAVQLVVRDTLTLAGDIDARGRSGQGGSGDVNGGGGGGGGGAGGAIFLEAYALVIDPGAGVCANGGSGGEGGTATPGAGGNDGTCSATVGATTPDTSTGGNGGAGAYVGGAALAGSAGATAASGGGGGGGGVGRIRLRGVASRMISGSATVSPAAVP